MKAGTGMGTTNYFTRQVEINCGCKVPGGRATHSNWVQEPSEPALAGGLGAGRGSSIYQQFAWHSFSWISSFLFSFFLSLFKRWHKCICYFCYWTNSFISGSCICGFSGNIVKLTISAESLGSGFGLDLAHMSFILGGLAGYPWRVLLIVKGGSIGD